MVITDNRKPMWIFYPGWVVLSAISVPIAWVVGLTLISQVQKAVGYTIQVGGQTHITEDFLTFYFFLPVLGLLTGFLQYLLLRRYLPRIGWWITATVLGWLVLTVVLGLFALFSAILSPVLANVLIGGFVVLPQLFQWLVLRHRVHHSVWWILAGVLGWGAAFLAAGGPISNPLDVLAVVLLPPTAASIALWLLLDKLPQRESNGRNAPPNTDST